MRMIRINQYRYVNSDHIVEVYLRSSVLKDKWFTTVLLSNGSSHDLETYKSLEDGLRRLNQFRSELEGVQYSPPVNVEVSGKEMK